jgi:hypothetical protein
MMIAIAGSLRQADPDLWGHVRFGQAIISGRHLLLHDPYSYSAFGHVSGNHEWLTDVIMAAIYNAFGVIGLKLWKFACTAATILFIALAASYTGGSPNQQLYTVGMAAVAITPHMQFRPQLFTFLLFAALLALLARHTYRRAAPLWLAVPMMALWANLHGGFIIGIISLTLYTGVALLQDVSARRPIRSSLRVIWLTLAATLATFLTPYLASTWTPVLHALRNPITHRVIDDWQPFTLFVNHAGRFEYSYTFLRLFALALIGALIVSVCLTPRDCDQPLIAIAAVMSIGSFVAIRNVPLAVIACVAPTTRHMGLLKFTASSREIGRSRLFSGRNRWLATMLALGLAVGTGRLFSSRLTPYVPCPSGAVAFMKERGLHGNILNEFGWGDYLIWHMTPASKVFMDGRYDSVYPPEVIEDYFNFSANAASARKVLLSYPHDFVLIPPRLPAYSFMVKTPGWKLIYQDQNSALFARTDSAAAKLPGLPIISTAPSNEYFP